ncbi:MAG: anti-sigma factor [Saprospiraceae bacterium]|nr:anti-sigma factor [Saprospiraceae bacterium]
MNIEQYIQSGILEAYALGACSTAEQVEVEEMMSAHPEIKSALDAIHADLEKLARAGAVSPPPALKARIMEAVEREAMTMSQQQTAPLHSAPTKKTPYSRLGYILAGIAFAVGALSIWMFQGKINTLQEQREADQLKIAECETRNERLLQTENQIALLGRPSTNPILLTALPGQSEDMQAWVFHNPAEGNTLFAPAALPAPPSGKSWQLWALVDGVPQSMGVIPDDATEEALLSVPFVADAQAFAISLEPAGGSTTPTEVVMLGKV